MNHGNRREPAARRMDVEAQVLAIIRELRESEYESGLAIKEIASRVIERHGEDFERKITPHWIGYLLRKKLGLKTERSKVGYLIASTEGPKLERLFERYGITNDAVNLVNSVNSEGMQEQHVRLRSHLLLSES